MKNLFDSYMVSLFFWLFGFLSITTYSIKTHSSERQPLKPPEQKKKKNFANFTQRMSNLRKSMKKAFSNKLNHWRKKQKQTEHHLILYHNISQPNTFRMEFTFNPNLIRFSCLNLSINLFVFISFAIYCCCCACAWVHVTLFVWSFVFCCFCLCFALFCVFLFHLLSIHSQLMTVNGIPTTFSIWQSDKIILRLYKSVKEKRTWVDHYFGT